MATKLLSSMELVGHLEGLGFPYSMDAELPDAWPVLDCTPETHATISTYCDATLRDAYLKNYLIFNDDSSCVRPSTLLDHSLTRGESLLIPEHRKPFVFGLLAWLADQFEFPADLAVWIVPSGISWQKIGVTNGVEMLALRSIRKLIRDNRIRIPDRPFAVESTFAAKELFDLLIEFGSWDRYAEWFVECSILDFKSRCVYTIHHHDDIRIIAPHEAAIESLIEQQFSNQKYQFVAPIRVRDDSVMGE